MMGRVMKLLRGFPKIFQPLNYAIRRRTTKKRGHKETDDNAPTLHLPPISRSKSYALPDNNEKNPPLIRIRRARSLKPNNTLSTSESNLRGSRRFNDNLLNQSLKKKSVSVSNSLNINNNSIKKYFSTNDTHKDPSVNKSQGTKTSNKKSEKNVKGKTKLNPTKLNQNQGSEIPRIVAEVIGEATGTGGGNTLRRGSNGRIKLERVMVRIINGADPSVQSQVLLNTKTSQPWEDLVKDLGEAVRLANTRRVGNRLETLYGRQVSSYSQLRSELKVGNNTFYIYVDRNYDDNDDYLYHPTLLPNLQRQRLSLTPEPYMTSNSSSRMKRSASNVSDRSRSKISLAKTWSNSSSELSPAYSNSGKKFYLDVPSEYGSNSNYSDQTKEQRRHRRRSHEHYNNNHYQSPSPTTPVPSRTSTIRLPEIVGAGSQQRFRRRSVSPAGGYGYHHTASRMEGRVVHFQS